MSLAPRSPLLRVLRLGAFLWFALSVLGLVAAFVLLAYGAGWGCRAPATDMGWFPCVLAYGMAIPMALGSLFMSGVMLLFAHLFYRAGMQVEQAAPQRTRFFSRENLASAIVDIFD